MLTRFMLANAIRALSMDAVQKANSGHPGMPMGMADIAEVLWNDFLKHNPNNPQWFNRDRFILSNGHGCMLQYAALHLSGYPLTIEDIKQFRQLHSKTPGHPEYGVTPGVEATTGPLGQGLANAVGMALAEQLLANHFNREGHKIIDHYTYCFAGDGCLMEGISHEAGSLAGTLGIGKLIVFWDNNSISIDGKVEGWFLDDTPSRFAAYGWHVIRDVDGLDPEKIKQAILEARSVDSKPSFIACKTIIGFGAPDLQGTAKTHGAALGPEEVQKARETLHWPYPPFEIPEEIYDGWDARSKGERLEDEWQTQLKKYQEAYPELYSELMRRINHEFPASFKEKMKACLGSASHNKEDMATRKASQKVLEVLVPLLPELLGGSADLSESNLTETKDSITIRPGHLDGNYIHYGVREFAMSAMMNGIALHGGFIPYGGTFLTFSDYARNALRLAALMKIRVIFIYSHDSIGLGEDGPTHQPVEHLAMLRATPNMSVWRPADITETVVAWTLALQRMEGPTSLILTRQNVKALMRTPEQVELVYRGAYVLRESVGDLHGIIIATGSEVELAVEAWERLTEKGYGIRVVSMPSMDVFLKQDTLYQQSVLPDTIRARVAVEAAARIDWYRWVGLDGEVVGIDRYGESAPYKKVMEDLGITVNNIMAAVEKILKRKKNDD